MVISKLTLEEVAKLFAKEVAQQQSEIFWEKYANSFQAVKEEESILLKALDFTDITFYTDIGLDGKPDDCSFCLDSSDKYEDCYISFSANKTDNWSQHQIRMMLLVLLVRRQKEGFPKKAKVKESGYYTSHNDEPFQKKCLKQDSKI
jgi:hypothetical protein